MRRESDSEDVDIGDEDLCPKKDQGDINRYT